VAVFGARRRDPIAADETIEPIGVVAVSGGIRGTRIVLAPAGHLRPAQARIGAIGKIRPGD